MMDAVIMNSATHIRAQMAVAEESKRPDVSDRSR